MKNKKNIDNAIDNIFKSNIFYWQYKICAVQNIDNVVSHHRKKLTMLSEWFIIIDNILSDSASIIDNNYIFLQLILTISKLVLSIILKILTM